MMVSALKKCKKSFTHLMIQLKFFIRLCQYNHAEARIFYLMGLGDRFPNLGDQAQAAAIPLWFTKHFKWPVIEIKNDEVRQCLPLLIKKIQPQDIIFLHSGGNFGDDWYQTQLDRELIISSLPNHPIVQLPQTIYYSASNSGMMAQAQSQKVIDHHAKMLIIGRDFFSATLAQQIFKSPTISAKPDMVLSLHEYLNNQFESANLLAKPSFKKVLLILRNDKEGIHSDHDKTTMLAALSEAGYEAQIWDTDVDDHFPDHAKLNTLKKYLRYIASFDAVITDRYHGLIFSVLVKKPCVVMKTHNHKLTSAFDWFEDVNFTKRADSFAEILAALHALNQLSEYHAPDWTKKYFDPMAQEVKQFLTSHRPPQLVGNG